MTKQDILDNSIPYEKGICYLYYLINEREIVYVGTTENLSSRLKVHESDNKLFDSYTFYEVNPKERYQHESVEIVKYAPMYNTSIPCTKTVNKLNLRRFSNKNESHGNWCLMNGNIYHIANYNGKSIEFGHVGMNNTDFYRGRIARQRNGRYSVVLEFNLHGNTIKKDIGYNMPVTLSGAIDVYLDACIAEINKVNFNL